MIDGVRQLQKNRKSAALIPLDILIALSEFGAKARPYWRHTEVQDK